MTNFSCLLESPLLPFGKGSKSMALELQAYVVLMGSGGGGRSGWKRQQLLTDVIYCVCVFVVRVCVCGTDVLWGDVVIMTYTKILLRNDTKHLQVPMQSMDYWLNIHFLNCYADMLVRHRQINSRPPLSNSD